MKIKGCVSISCCDVCAAFEEVQYVCGSCQLWNVSLHLEPHLQALHSEIHCMSFGERFGLICTVFFPPSWLWEKLFGRQEEFETHVEEAGRSSGWGRGRMYKLIHHSGKVGIQKNVDADQQEGIKTTEPGPEHTLSDSGNSGSWSLIWSPHCWDAQSCRLTTCHPPSWLRACNVTYTHARADTGSYSGNNYNSMCVQMTITWWCCEYSYPGSYGGWQRTLSVTGFLFVAPQWLSTTSDYAPRREEKGNAWKVDDW